MLELFKTLIGDYQNCIVTMRFPLKPCLAVNQPTKGLFTQQLVTASSESKSEEPPRDYSEGSSGLLKTDKETSND